MMVQPGELTTLEPETREWDRAVRDSVCLSPKDTAWVRIMWGQQHTRTAFALSD